MICRLFEYEFDIGKSKNCELVTVKDCPHCGDTCEQCVDLNTKKTKNKFSWTISRRLTFPEGYGDELVAIKLIHPSSNSIWIVKKVVEGSYKFQVHIADMPKDGFMADSLGELNYQLKDKIQFDGMDIVSEDFE